MRSEVHFERELDDAVVRGGADVARLRADGGAGAAEGTVGEVHVGIGPLRVVQDVEELAAELEVESLARWQRIEVLD